MDKKRLNNEIILCRPAVRKARVAVIRKILKRMKILKTCKIDVVKEKKQKKCERLFKKVQIMKKVKDDEVTKFALGIQDLETFLKKPKLNLRQSALAYLGKHEAITKKINSIREQIPNWETELPILLNSLGKKKKKKLKDKSEVIETNVQTAKPVGSEVSEGKKNNKNKEIIFKKKMIKTTENKIKGNNINGKSIESDEDRESKKNGFADRISENITKTEKVDDPFFVGKKVIAPKLVFENLSNKRNSRENISKTWNKKEINSSAFHKSPFKAKKEYCKVSTQKLESEEEKLHPSWAAKKVKLIKPFEGTKIKFSED